MQKWGSSQSKRKRGRPRTRRSKPPPSRVSPYALPFVYMLIGALLWTYGPPLWQAWLKPVIEQAWDRRIPTPAITPSTSSIKPKAVKKQPAPEKKPEVTFHFYQMLTHKKAPLESLKEDRKALSGYTLQIGAFKTQKTCADQVRTLKEASWSVVTDHYQSGGQSWCRVMVGPFSTLTSAYQAKNQLYQLGYNGLLKSYTK